MKGLHRNNTEAGFTLIEMLMAMAILGIGILSIVALQTSNVTRNTSAKKRTEGYTWIMDQIENLHNLDYSHTDLANQGDPVAVVDGDGHIRVQGPYTIEWDVADNGSGGLGNVDNSKRVHVTARWNGREVATVDFVRTQTSF